MEDKEEDASDRRESSKMVIDADIMIYNILENGPVARETLNVLSEYRFGGKKKLASPWSLFLSFKIIWAPVSNRLPNKCSN